MITEQDGAFSFTVTQISGNQTAFDMPRNLANIYRGIKIAAERGSDMVVFEELALTGYDAGDEFIRTDNKVIKAHLDDIKAYAAALDPNLIVSIGHPWRFVKRDVKVESGLEAERSKNALFNRLDLPFNVQSILSGGEWHAATAKMDLFNEERGYEKRYFQEWSMADANAAGGTYGTLQLKDQQGPAYLGRPILHVYDPETGYALNLAQVICEERWKATKYGGAPYTDDLYDRDGVVPSYWRQIETNQGLLINIPNASPPAARKIDKHVHLVKLASRYAEAVIDTDGLGTSGSTYSQFGHQMIAQDGEIIAFGERNSFDRVHATTTTIRLRPAPYWTKESAHISLVHHFKNATKVPSPPSGYGLVSLDTWDRPNNPDRDHEESVRMAALYLFDLLRKNKHQGIVEALSGGQDSSFNCVVVYAMVNLAMRELGVDGFLNEMSHLKYADKILTANAAGGIEAAIKTCMDNILTTVYMPTQNNPNEHYLAAKTLIEGGADDQGVAYPGIGGKFMTINVQDLLNFNALVYAVHDTSKIEPHRKGDLLKAVSEYLNQKPKKCETKAELDVHLADLDRQAAELRAQFPEIDGDLISVADPRHQVAYENIQARARGILVMLMANVEGKIAIANPNLDEAYNAYATFMGDLHSGTINLNGFIHKDDEQKAMVYMMNKGLHGGAMPPVKALLRTMQNTPSAGLLPLDKDGKLMQTDEDQLQRSYPQMKALSAMMIRDRVMTTEGLRRLNATEVYDKAAADPLFAKVSPAWLYNAVRLTYERFYGPAQPKIHATPYGPTFGLNIDHQVSLRTPNVNGRCQDELTQLGLTVIDRLAVRDGVTLAGFDKDLLLRRAVQDEQFVSSFTSLARNRNEKVKQVYDIGGLYHRMRDEGIASVLPALKADHPLAIISAYRQRSLQP